MKLEKSNESESERRSEIANFGRALLAENSRNPKNQCDLKFVIGIGEREFTARRNKLRCLCGTQRRAIRDRGIFLERRNGRNSAEESRFGIALGISDGSENSRPHQAASQRPPLRGVRQRGRQAIWLIVGRW